MLNIEFSTDNAAFSDQPEDDEDTPRAVSFEAVADVLDTVARKVREGSAYGPVLDANGNTVGRYELRES